MQFELKKAKGYLPHIGLIAIGIGTANYIINGNFNWIQWIILALSTNLIIGYSLLATKDIVYFEAFDNYAFVYDSKGKKGSVIILFFFFNNG